MIFHEKIQVESRQTHKQHVDILIDQSSLCTKKTGSNDLPAHRKKSVSKVMSLRISKTCLGNKLPELNTLDIIHCCLTRAAVYHQRSDSKQHLISFLVYCFVGVRNERSEKRIIGLSN